MTFDGLQPRLLDRIPFFATVFLAVSLVFQLTPALAMPTLTVNGSNAAITVSAGTTVTLVVQNGPGTADCVTLTGTADSTHQGFAWVSSTSASLPFSLSTTPGTYVFRYWQNCSTQIAVSPTVTVQAGGAPSLTVNSNSAPITVVAGATVIVGIQNGPGNRYDYVALFQPGN